jgi:hypothetical protein
MRSAQTDRQGLPARLCDGEKKSGAVSRPDTLHDFQFPE